MKSRPITFTGDMVKATRAGRKTVTRRLTGLNAINEDPDRWTLVPHQSGYPIRDGVYVASFRLKGLDGKKHGGQKDVKCPYGKPGDQLWVKESLWIDNNYMPGLNWPTTFHVWQADEERSSYEEHMLKSDMVQFVTGRFMYKEMCRTKLDIVSIGVERLEDITDEQAIAEGIKKQCDPTTDFPKGIWKNYLLVKSKYGGFECENPRDSYLSLFKLINRKAPPNPWVWVVTYKLTSHA